MRIRVQGLGARAAMGAIAIGLLLTPTQVRAAPPAPTTSDDVAETSESIPDEVPLRMGVRTELGETDATVAPLVRKQVRERLHAQGFRDVQGADRELSVVVRWANAGTAEPKETYALEYSLATLRRPTPSVLLTTTCERCGLGELMSRLDEDIEALRPQLTAPLEADPPPPRPVESPPAAVSPPEAPPRRVPLLAVGKAGVGVLVVGAAGLAAGIGMLTVPTRERSMGVELERTSYRVPGIATVSVGASAVVVGIVLLAVDRSRAAKSRGTTASR